MFLFLSSMALLVITTGILLVLILYAWVPVVKFKVVHLQHWSLMNMVTFHVANMHHLGKNHSSTDACMLFYRPLRLLMYKFYHHHHFYFHNCRNIPGCSCILILWFHTQVDFGDLGQIFGSLKETHCVCVCVCVCMHMYVYVIYICICICAGCRYQPSWQGEAITSFVGIFSCWLAHCTNSHSAGCKYSPQRCKLPQCPTPCSHEWRTSRGICWSSNQG